MPVPVEQCPATVCRVWCVWIREKSRKSDEEEEEEEISSGEEEEEDRRAEGDRSASRPDRLRNRALHFQRELQRPVESASQEVVEKKAK